MFYFMRRVLGLGLVLWAVGTIAIRIAGASLLEPGASVHTVLLYAASFGAMALVVPRLCRRLGIRPDAWLPATAVLILPTLLLDPLSCLFFGSVFPNIDPRSAGAFGGWMLACCAGAVVGAWARAPRAR